VERWSRECIGFEEDWAGVRLPYSGCLGDWLVRPVWANLGLHMDGVSFDLGLWGLPGSYSVLLFFWRNPGVGFVGFIGASFAAC